MPLLRAFAAVAAFAILASCHSTPSPPDEGELELVAAVFRHGVRAPLADFASHAGKHSAHVWPNEQAWGVGVNKWGDLTPHGADLARLLGRDYARRYDRPSFEAYLWADAGERTRATANGLALGFQDAGVKVTVDGIPGTANDPLFHPFKAACGTPDPTKLDAIAQSINAQAPTWIRDTHAARFQLLYNVLACPSAGGTCTPLSHETDHATPCADHATCSAPIAWKGQFSYASSASEAFLLEYANGMHAGMVGWGQALPPALQSMLGLHEFYFDQLDREPYLARLQASNLVREVMQALDRKAGRPVEGCPHGGAQPFIGWVGHDTDLASLGKLLGITWRFDSPGLPPDTRGLPANNALPAGALVFELRRRGSDYFVSIEYATLSLQQMRDPAGTPASPAYRIAVECEFAPGTRCANVPLDRFREVARAAIGPEFLSRCDAAGKQTCP